MRHLALLITLAVSSTGPISADPAKRIGGIDLVWHWEGAGDSGANAADTPINPASVVKLATTLWALETLGPEHRFRTTVSTHGKIDPETGVLYGDLIVIGGGDPDFHVENAQLLANTLKKRGIQRVTGTLYVNDAFWVGWENGSEGKVADPAARAAKMAKRLAKAWNPRTWTPQTLRAMREFRQRTDDVEFISLPIDRVAGLYDGEEPGEILAEHQSNPLVTILKRFNDFSNNDIERLGHLLGDASAMTEFYRSRWQDSQPEPVFATLSGLGSNRMTPRQITRLLRELNDAAAAHELSLSDLLPALGCGRNTLRNYRGLLESMPEAGLVGKTGTLVQTDGGVVTLAGSIRTDGGDVVFFIGAPRNGARMNAARRAQTRWLLERTEGWPIVGGECSTETLHSHQEASAR